MSRVAILGVLVLVLGSCARSGSSGPGISPRPPVAPEERSTCEVLARADLGVVAEDRRSLRRSASASREAADLAPLAVRLEFDEMADAHRRAADGIVSADQLRQDPVRDFVLAWEATHCGHSI